MSNITFVGQDWPHNPKFHDFTYFLEMYPKKDAKGYYLSLDDRILTKMKDIYQWAMFKAQTKDHEEIKATIKKLTQRIGTNTIGEVLVNRLWQYVSMDTKINSLQYEMNKMAEKQDMTLQDYIDKQDELVTQEKRKHLEITKRIKPAEGKELVEPESKVIGFHNEMKIPVEKKQRAVQSI